MSAALALHRLARSGALRLLLLGLLALGLTLVFVALLFPWDAVARRLAYEIGVASGARVGLEELAPAFTARGPVLRARNVTIEHPSVQTLRVAVLELAPRLSTSWLAGEPRLRVYADSDLGVVDGRLRLGSAPAFDGRIERVAIERLPLRLEAAGVEVAGELTADADVELDPGGTLRGGVAFESPRLRIATPLLPLPLVFSRAQGSITLLETGATRIDALALEGEQLRGTLAGEIGLVHHSQPPPLDLRADLELLDPELRALALAARLPIDADGRGAMQIGGSAAVPVVLPAASGEGGAGDRVERDGGNRIGAPGGRGGLRPR